MVYWAMEIRRWFVTFSHFILQGCAVLNVVEGKKTAAPLSDIPLERHNRTLENTYSISDAEPDDVSVSSIHEIEATPEEPDREPDRAETSEDSEDQEKVPETPLSFAEPQQLILDGIVGVRSYPPVSTTIKQKLDEILENQRLLLSIVSKQDEILQNQRALFSFMSTFLGQVQNSGVDRAQDQGRAQVLDQGSAQNLGQGRAQAFVRGGIEY